MTLLKVEVNEMEKTKLTKDQKKTVSFKGLQYDNESVDLIIKIRYDDECGNGHNTFSITGDLYKAGKRSDSAYICGGCIHEIIEKLAPEYKKYIKWHLMSSNGPLHYVANTLYWASKVEKYNYYVYLKDNEFKINELLGIFDEEQSEDLKKRYGYENILVEKRPDSMNKDSNLENARSTAIAPNATLEQLRSEEWLKARLPQLVKDFKTAMEELGFTY